MGERPTTTSITTRKFQTTSKPFTTKRDSFTTRYMKTTWQPQTTERFVTLAPRTSSSSSSSKSSFVWLYGLITAVVVITIILIVSILLCRKFTSKSNAPGGGAGQVLSLSQPQVVYDKYAMASNPSMPQYNSQTGNIGAGTTAASGVTVKPNLQEHLMVTNTGIPPYIIQEKKNANVRGSVTAVPVNKMHQTSVHTAERTQPLPHPYANITKEKTNNEASVKYLPQL